MIWPRKLGAKQLLPSLKLEGFRVVLRPPALTDRTRWEKVRRKNRKFLQALEPTWPEDCLVREFYERRLTRQIKDWQQGRAYSFLIFTYFIA